MNNIEVWFQDEARVGQQGTTTRIWAEKGTRPRVIKQLQYEYAYLFGAVCPERDVAVALVVPDVGIDGMLAHLKHISESVLPGKIAVLVFDRAPWHTTKKIDVFPNLRFLPLPPASPELNPVEQVWQQLRDNSFANRSYRDYSDIQQVCCDVWMSYTQQKGRIASLCSRKWATLNCKDIGN